MARASDSGGAPFTGQRPPFKRVLAGFINYYGPYRHLLFADLACAVLLATVQLSFPQVLRFLSEGLFSTGTHQQILDALPLIIGGMIALAIVGATCQYFITYWGHLMGARMESDMRRDLFDQYQRLSFSYYDRNNTGEMMSKLVSDLFEISELAHHGPEDLLISALMLTGSVVMLALINVPMTLLLALVTGFVVWYSLRKNRQMGEAFLDNRRKIASVNSRLQDTLAGIRVVKSFGNERVEAGKFSEGNRAFLDSKRRAYRKMAEMVSVNTLSQGLLYATVLGAGGYFLTRGALTLTDLAVYALYIAIFMTPIKMLVEFTEQAQKGYSGFLRLLEVLAEPPGIEDRPGAVTLTPREGVRGSASTKGKISVLTTSQVKEKGSFGEVSGLSPVSEPKGSFDTEMRSCVCAGEVRYRDVRFSYDGVVDVICGLNLSIPAGRTVALVGPSGGGKTTLCSLLPRFYDVREGAVLIDGHDVRDVTLKSLRGSIGIVQQETYLFNGTIGENIAYGRPGASQKEIEAAARDTNIADFIDSLEDGYDTFVGERGARLSGGQKQRIAIARVFLKDPALLILDEATSTLDNESEREVQTSLARLTRNRTTLIIAHRLSTIRSAQTIAVIDQGRVVEQGSHETLLASGRTYARYYELQFGTGAGQ